MLACEEDMDRLKRSRGMLEGMESKIKTYLSIDLSGSTMLPPVAAQSGLIAKSDIHESPFARSKSFINPITETRKLGEKEYNLKRKLDSFQRQSTTSNCPKPPSVRDFDAPSKIMQLNRRSDYQLTPQNSSRKSNRKYTFLSKLIATETVTFENRIEFFKQMLKSQEQEIRKLTEELEQTKKTSALNDDYALPPSLEGKYMLIKFRGKPPKTVKEGKPKKPVLIEENSEKNVNRSVHFADPQKGTPPNASKSIRDILLGKTSQPSSKLNLSTHKKPKSSNRRGSSKDKNSKSTKKKSKSKSRQSSAAKNDKSNSKHGKGLPPLNIPTVENDPLVKDAASVISKAKMHSQSSHRSNSKGASKLLNPILNLIDSFR